MPLGFFVVCVWGAEFIPQHSAEAPDSCSRSFFLKPGISLPAACRAARTFVGPPMLEAKAAAWVLAECSGINSALLPRFWTAVAE